MECGSYEVGNGSPKAENYCLQELYKVSYSVYV